MEYPLFETRNWFGIFWISLSYFQTRANARVTI